MKVLILEDLENTVRTQVAAFSSQDWVRLLQNALEDIQGIQEAVEAAERLSGVGVVVFDPYTETGVAISRKILSGGTTPVVFLREISIAD